ncbi:MAG: response regulator [Rhodobacterales bacterium]|nr:response regulator [Rhodobacterales bacterium]
MSRILLVEDNEMNLDMLSRRLKRRKFDVDIAEDGGKALEMAASLPDIILLDMSLPVMDGWAVAVRLKTDQATCRIPIIALTAHAMVGDRERALSVGCDEYETKPIDFKQLVSKIQKLLGVEA